MPLTLRNLEPQDGAEIVQMIAALASHIDPEISPQTDIKAIDRYGPSGAGYFNGVVAEQAGRLIGMCLYSVCFSAWRGLPGVFVSELFVDPSVRTEGLGRNLLREVARIGASQGCRFLQLDVDIQNETAIDFYAHIGMHHLTRDIQMFLEPDDFLNFILQRP